MPQLVCPVRNCHQPLQRAQRVLACPAGHSFDVSTSGYVNLLQPQDRRAREPGDSAEITQARRRGLERGLGNALLAALQSELQRAGVVAPASMLDVGAGDGFFGGSLAASTELQVWGVDLSKAAVSAAARRYPSLRWFVANADRRLPFADGSFDAVTSITGPKHGDELRRVLSPRGPLLLAVPGPDDQRELREAVLGEAHQRSSSQRMQELFAPWFELDREQEVHSRHQLDAAALEDLFNAGYRGGRNAQRERLSGLQSLEVTVAYSLLTFRPR